MKPLALIVAGLALMALSLMGLVMQQQTTPASDCTGRVVMVKSPSGEAIECTCVSGTVASCFNPVP